MIKAFLIIVIFGQGTVFTDKTEMASMEVCNIKKDYAYQTTIDHPEIITKPGGVMVWCKEEE